MLKTNSPEYYMGTHARDNIDNILDQVNDGHDLNVAMMDAVNQSFGACPALTTNTSQHFANGLLVGIDELAHHYHVSTNATYLDNYHIAQELIEHLTRDNFDQLTSQLKKLRRLIDELSINTNDIHDLKRTVADLLAAYAPAKEDTTIATGYQALNALYTTSEELPAATWQKGIQQFINKLPGFQKSIRSYIYNIVDSLKGQVDHYDIREVPEIVDFFDEIDLLVHASARPCDFTDIMARVDECENLIAQNVSEHAPLATIREFTTSIVSNLQNALANGVQLSADSHESFRDCQTTLYGDKALDRDDYVNLINQLKDIRIAKTI